MIQELADEIWAGGRFHAVSRDIERAWICRELGLPGPPDIQPELGKRVMQAAAILAASEHREHRAAAYRAATNTFQLLGCCELPLDQVLNVVLTRLGNFPARETDARVAASTPALPLSLAIEEAAARGRNSVALQGRQIELTDFQLELWLGLSKGDRVAVSAPTSAGKSFLLQAYLMSLFSRVSVMTIVYIVPTRALIAQVSEDLLVKLADVEIIYRPTVVTVPPDPEEPLPKCAVYVMTQERLQMCLSIHREFSADLIIVDEAHNVSDGGRGILLQWVIDDLLHRAPAAQILFAAPLVRNLEIFKSLFGLESLREMPSGEPTVSQNFLRVDISPGKSGRIKLVHLGDGTASPEQLAELELGQPLATRKDRLVQIAGRLGHGKLNIVYANGPAEAEKVAILLADYFRDRETTDARRALADLVREAVHKDFALAYCVEKGIGYHFSDIPTVVRRGVEDAAANGVIDFIVCTSTLLQGVNLPAKNIFLLQPTKGQGHALLSMDFWNLVGRAGRLGREFQGNIFLIAYEDWDEKPLSGPKDSTLVSALERSVSLECQALLAVVRNEQVKDDIDMETAFGRLISDFREGRLKTTLQRINVTEEMERIISEAINAANVEMRIPLDVIRQTPTISAHKQQALYNELLKRIEVGGESAANALIPRHPLDAKAYESYSSILQLCHRRLLGLEGTRLHTFHALLAVWWSSGVPLPQIVQNRLDRLQPSDDRAANIRETLKLIEQEIRFKTVRLFSCYTALLIQALKDTGFTPQVASVPAIGLYLEVGAHARTMISLMSLGLSRVVAARLTDLASDKNMDLEATRAWLKKAPIDALGLSLLLRDEVNRLNLASAA